MIEKLNLSKLVYKISLGSFILIFVVSIGFTAIVPIGNTESYTEFFFYFFSLVISVFARYLTPIMFILLILDFILNKTKYEKKSLIKGFFINLVFLVIYIIFYFYSLKYGIGGSFL